MAHEANSAQHDDVIRRPASEQVDAGRTARLDLDQDGQQETLPLFRREAWKKESPKVPRPGRRRDRARTGGSGQTIRTHCQRAFEAPISALKKARIPAPSLVLGRVLEVVSQAGLFEQGITLVGTAAYQVYAPVLGYYLPSSALMTHDVDLSVAEFVESDEQNDLEAILKQADDSFTPRMRNEDKLPAVFQASNGLTVDVLTRYGRGRKSPVLVPSLKCAAEALSFQEYLAEETIEAVALYGLGVPVRVPAPERFAIHKLIVAQRRPRNQAAKRRKDLQQAKELIDILLESDEALLQDTLDEARDKGRTWKSLVNASLRELKRDVRQGRLPVPVKTPRGRSAG